MPTQLRAGDLDKIVNVMRPTKNLDARGQLLGKDDTIIANWPCSIETLSGTKGGNERMTVPNASHRVEGYGDPKNPIKDKDYLTGGSLGTRIFTIELKNDKDFNETKLSLVCSEQKLG